MNISQKLTISKLKEILIDIYIKGEKAEDINLTDMIKEINKQVIFTINTKE